MAHVTIEELRQLVNDHTNWQAQGDESPRTILSVKFPPDPKNLACQSDGTVFAPELVRKTITYDSLTTTVVLDFDEWGYLCNIEFV